MLTGAPRSSRQIVAHGLDVMLKRGFGPHQILAAAEQADLVSNGFDHMELVARLRDALEPERGSAQPPAAAEPKPRRNGSQVARRIVSELPESLIAGGESWVPGRMAEHIDRILAEGYGPWAIVTTARRMHLEPVDRDQFAPLRALRATLAVQVGRGEICRACGDDLTSPTSACFNCDPEAGLTEPELEQLARIHAELGVSA